MTSKPLLLAVLAAATIACGSSAATTVTTPATSRCQATVSNSATTFTPAGGTGTVTVVVSRDCSWTAVVPESWITLTSAASGQGDGTITYRVSENSEPVQRQAAISVAERQVAVAQEPAPCRFELEGIPASVASTGGEAVIDLETHAACTWSAQVDQNWADIAPESGKGPAALKVSVAPNPGTERALSVSVGNARATMMQQAAAATPPPTPTPSPAPTPTPSPTPTPTPTPTPSPSPTPTPSPSPTPDPAPQPTPVREINLEGEARSVSGSCPTLTFTLGGRTVYTTSQTEFAKGPCKNVKNGADLEVRGYLMSDNRVRADRVKFDDDDDDDNDDDD